ncbi:glycosyltransferase [candidate division KSB1 bacterium]|nr:glycosyltransferase [candidate division KSB1 bacterium]
MTWLDGASILLFTLTGLYLLAMNYLMQGLRRLKRGQATSEPSISVVVAARNEAANITRCVTALLHQRYPVEKFEILVVDDRSTDHTADLVREIARTHSQLKLISITATPPEMAPKKYALATGIQAAKGELIFTTDADCTPLPDWLKITARYFEPAVGLVAGFAPLESRTASRSNWLQKMYGLESLALACVAAGGIGKQRPLTCSGRNLAYRKQVFEAVGGFARIGQHISGDDDLFLQQVAATTNWEIRYVFEAAALVYSPPPANFTLFKNQRTRHASKGRHYQPWLTGVLGGVYLYNFMLWLGLIAFPFLPIQPVFILLVSLALKIAAEFGLLLRGAQLFRKRYLLWVFPLATLAHIPYVVIFGCLGAFKTFQWKDQTFQAQIENA